MMCYYLIVHFQGQKVNVMSVSVALFERTSPYRTGFIRDFYLKSLNIPILK